ncbi:MAG: hypothetical protein HY814_15455 [Candidatus Riflebacteria bacterium]|nr:hypothetical protein [Candidatus Riflebacteria bacterium]
MLGTLAFLAVLLLTFPALYAGMTAEAAWVGSSGQKVAVHFAPKPAGHPDGIEVHLINFFNKAVKTLHGCFYEIREQKFVDALIAAKKRQVDVKLLVDNTSYFFRNEDGTLAPRKLNAFVQQLVDAGIEVRHDLGRSALMHNKFCIIDKRFVWSGSVNLTDTYATNCNNGVELESPKLAAIYEREFDKKFTQQLFGRNAPSYAEEQKVNVDGIDCEVLYAPEDDPMSRILVLLNGAKKSIHFMQFAFTDERVTTILQTRFKAGVEVSGIFDHRLYRSTGPYGDFSALTRAGVPVQLYGGPGLFHHKVFIIDAGTPHAKVVTGSQNASARGNNQNDENVLVLHDKATSELFMAEFNRVHQESTVVGAVAVYDKDPVVGSTLPALDVMINSNGIDVRRLKIEYPARWPLDPSQQVGISIWRAGRNVSKQVGVEFYSKGFYVNKPGMTPTGADSVLELHFRNIQVPAIAGVYNLYISVAQGDNPTTLKPCRLQPTINVRPEGGASSAARVEAVRDEALQALNGYVGQGQGPGQDQARQVADPGSVFDAFKNDVATEISDGRLDSVRLLVESLEKMSVKDRQAVDALSSREREIRRALRYFDPESPLAPEAAQLLQRLEAAARN